MAVAAPAAQTPERQPTAATVARLAVAVAVAARGVARREASAATVAWVVMVVFASFRR